MSADLHTHSRFSDGTQTPAELVAEAAAAGLSTIALTDHDTTAGWEQAAAAAQDHGLGLVRGMEVSCRWHGISVHMLCYLQDPGPSELSSEIARMRSSRLTRSREMVERLAADFPLSWADVEDIAGPEATIGRPHIADALVRHGVVENRSAAFEQLLSSRGPYYVSLDSIDPAQAVRMIHQAGGVAVFAHPRASMRGSVVPDAGMSEIIAAGLDGLEVDHRDNPASDRAQLRRIAAAHGLLVTGSSDYHGTGKPNQLAENTTDPQMLAQLIERASGTDYLPPR